MPNVTEFIVGATDCCRVGPDSRSSKEELAIFPGAFNPLHDGHRQMARIASARLQRSVHFELSIENVDKVSIDEATCRQRLSQFKSDESIWLTRAPLFVDKAELFPKATFVVGADTVCRIADLRYYQDQAAMRHSIARIAHAGCRFLVFGRLMDVHDFRLLSELSLPAALLRICDEVSEAEFRHDISSSQLRGDSRG